MVVVGFKLICLFTLSPESFCTGQVAVCAINGENWLHNSDDLAKYTTQHRKK